MRSIIVIPARQKSSRFPGKPLTPILGKPMIRWVWESCATAIGTQRVFVATDDESIARVVDSFGGQVQLTSPDCATGTDRLYDFSKHIAADLYINVQGDEPLIKPDEVSAFVEQAETHPDVVLNGFAPIDSEEEFRSLAVPKVVMRADGQLLYMSRAAIPGNKDSDFKGAHKQICMYSFPLKHLELFGTHPTKTPLEAEEDIEILRLVELGVPVHMVPCAGGTIAVDFPSDVQRVESLLRSKSQLS